MQYLIQYSMLIILNNTYEYLADIATESPVYRTGQFLTGTATPDSGLQSQQKLQELTPSTLRSPGYIYISFFIISFDFTTAQTHGRKRLKGPKLQRQIPSSICITKPFHCSHPVDLQSSQLAPQFKGPYKSYYFFTEGPDIHTDSMIDTIGAQDPCLRAQVYIRAQREKKHISKGLLSSQQFSISIPLNVFHSLLSTFLGINATSYSLFLMIRFRQYMPKYGSRRKAYFGSISVPGTGSARHMEDNGGIIAERHFPFASVQESGS